MRAPGTEGGPAIAEAGHPPPASIYDHALKVGFPSIRCCRREPYGIPADAKLGGIGLREGAFRLLNRVSADQQWIEPGFSGAGVLKLDGDHAAM
jgi:hypothetical protein